MSTLQKITFFIVSILALSGLAFAGGSIAPVEETIVEVPALETNSGFLCRLGI